VQPELHQKGDKVMTTVTLSKSKYQDQIHVNGRFVLFPNRITEIRRTRPGSFEGVASGSNFQIVGGRAAGGSRNEWHVSWDGIFNDYISARSFVDCINLIEKA